MTDDGTIDDGVALSNKGCRNYYARPHGSQLGCRCPSDRCWYDEQVARRKRGERALDPARWLQVAR